jgi:hypothetical protein
MPNVKSAIRVLEVLEQFGEMRQPLRLKDIASSLHYPVSSTAALLKSLATLGSTTPPISFQIWDRALPRRQSKRAH